MIKKKILSLLLAFAMVLGMLPFGEMVAYANTDPVAISRMVINNFVKIERNADGTPVYQDGALKMTKEQYIDIRGTGFKDQNIKISSVKVYKNSAKTEGVDTVGYTVETDSRITLKVDTSSTDSITQDTTYYPEISYRVENETTDKKAVVKDADGKEMGIPVKSIPDINGVDKYSLNLGDTLHINGSNLSGMHVFLKSGSSSTGFIPTASSDESINIKVENISTGLKDIYIRNNADDTKATATVTMLNGIEVFPSPTAVTVEEISPNSGPVTGGTRVRIKGKGLSANSLVEFGDRRARVESLVDDGADRVMTVVTPPQATTGIVDVKIDGNKKGTFQYLGLGNYLLVSRISPESGNALGGNQALIYGYNFQSTKTSGTGDAAEAVSAEDSYKLDVTKEKLSFTKNSLQGTEKPSNDAVSRVRSIEVRVDGKLATFDIDPTSSLDQATSIDKKTTEQILKIIVPPSGAITEDTKVSVQIRVVNKYYKGAVNPQNELSEFETVEEGNLDYTYETIKRPAVSEITPKYGPVSEDGGEKGQVVMNIKGSNFQVQRRQKDDETYEPVLPRVYLVPRNVSDELLKTGVNTVSVYLANHKDRKVYLEKNQSIVEVDGIVDKLGTEMSVVLPHSNKAEVRDLVIINPDGGFLRVQDAFVYKQKNTTPKINSVEPPKVNAQGGDTVVVKGENIAQFKEGVTVTVDGKAVTIDKLENKIESGNNIQEISFKAPKGPVGRKIVQVINEDGGMDSYGYYVAITDNPGEDFYYTRVTSSPKISVIAPSYGGAETKVIIKGSDFKKEERDGSSKIVEEGTVVYFDGYKIVDDKDKATGTEPDGAKYEIVDTNTIKITMPSGLPLGFKDVIVENPDTARDVVRNGFNYLSPQSKPSISGITPDYGTVDGGTIIKIAGSGFTDRVEVFFGEKKGLNPIVNGDGTEIRVTTPSYPIPNANTDSIPVDLTVMNYDGGSATEDDGFNYRVPGSFPKISKIDPNVGTTAGSQTVVITGEDFRYEKFQVTSGDDIESDLDFQNRTSYKEGDTVPKVYFGGEEALEVKYAGQSQLIVTTPPYMKPEKVDVVVVNPDAGTVVSKAGYTYERSKPTVTSVTPPYIDRNGNTRMTIEGTGFINGDYSSMVAQESKADMALDLEAVFGAQKASTTIIGGYGEVLIGNIKVVYDAQNPQNIQIISMAGFESKSFTGKVTTGKPLFMSLKTSGDAQIDEGIKVSMEGTRMTAERRASIKVVWEDENTITVVSPPMDGVGSRDLAIRNLDGGEAKTKVEVKNPASQPVITDIEPKLDVKGPNDITEYYSVESVLDGGITFTIKGADFRTGAKVFVGDQEAEVIARGPNDDSLTVRSPKGKATDIGKTLRIIVVNTDGGIADSSTGIGSPRAPGYYIYREAESSPKVTKIDPNKGSAIGGERVVITGEDFRPETGIEVKFGDRKAEVVRAESNYQKLVVLTPPSDTYGPVDVHIRNTGALGETIVANGFTYTSAPVIIKLEPDVVYSSGGEKVDIIGKGFQDGAKVTIGGEEVETKFIDEFKLQIITPEVELPKGVDSVKKDVTVTNPDGGETTKKDGITFTRPFPMRPTGFKATPQHGRTMMLEWNKVNIIERYRVEISESENGPYRYLAEVSGGEYLARDLKPDTKYYFKLWALNEYGQSQGFAMANNKTFTAAQDNQSEEFEDSTENKSEVVESGGNITINYAKNYSVEDYTHDFTDIKYSNYRTITLSIPASVVNANKGTLTLKHRDFELKSAISMFKSPEKSYNSGDTLKVTITKLFDGEQATALRYAPAGYAAQKQGVKMEYTVGDGRNNITLQNLNGIYLTTYVDKASLSELAHYSYVTGESSLQKEQSNFSKVYSNTHKKEIYKLDSYIKRSGYYIPLGR